MCFDCWMFVGYVGEFLLDYLNRNLGYKWMIC